MYENIKFVHHHLGMGDHISCHGIVRYLCETNETIGLFVKPHNYENVKYMYNDLQNLILFQMDDYQAIKFIKDNEITDVIRIGLAVGGDSSKCKRQNLEEDFYLMADLSPELKTQKFFINRNYEREIELFNSLNLEKKEYIFVHDGNDGIKSTLKFIDNDSIIVKPTTHGLFDWMFVIENSKEIHCIDSSFICLIDCMDTKDIPLYNHRYVKNYPDDIKLFTNKKWQFIL